MSEFPISNCVEHMYLGPGAKKHWSLYCTGEVWRARVSQIPPPGNLYLDSIPRYDTDQMLSAWLAYF